MALTAPIFDNPSLLSVVDLDSVVSNISNITVTTESRQEVIVDWTRAGIVENDSIVSLWSVGRVVDLDAFYLERKYVVMNFNHRWKVECRSTSDYESLMFGFLKDPLLYAKMAGIKDIRMELLPLKDYSLAMKILTSNSAVLGKMEHDNIAQPRPVLKLKDSDLGERSIVGFMGKIDDETEALKMAELQPTSYPRDKMFDPHWRPINDPAVNYDSYHAPVTRFEHTVITLCRELINDWYMNVEELRAFLQDISTSQYRIDIQYTMDRLIEMGAFEKIRILRQPTRKYNREYYLLTNTIADYARRRLKGQLKAQFRFKDALLVSNDITSHIRTSVVAKDIQSQFVGDISMVVVQPVIVSCYTALANPALTQIVFNERQMSDTFSMSSLYGALIATTCLPSICVADSARRFVCNYFARWIMIYTPPDTLTHLPAELQNWCDSHRWYASPRNLLFIMYQYKNQFHPKVQEFMGIFFKTIGTNRGLSEEEADTSPWSFGAPRHFPQKITMWQGYAQKIRYEAVDPVTMWPQCAMNDFCPERLNQLMNALKEMMSCHQTSRKTYNDDFIVRVHNLLIKSVSGLSQYMIKWLEASFAVALSPFANNRVYDKHVDFVVPYEESVYLKNFVSLMIYLRGDEPFAHPVQPDLSGDPKMQLYLPLVVDAYTQVTALLGQYASLYTKTERFDKAISVMAELGPIKFTELTKYFDDPEEIRRLIKYTTNDTVPDEIRKLQTNVQTIRSLLHEMRFCRGYRTAFYIAKIPVFFLPEIPGSYTAFACSAMPYCWNTLPAPFHLKASYTGVEFRNAKLSSYFTNANMTNQFVTDKLTKEILNLRTIPNPVGLLANTSGSPLPPIDVIRVEHPCMLDLDVTIIENGAWRQPATTPLETIINDLEHSITRNLPFIIKGELQFLSMGREQIRLDTVNRAFAQCGSIVSVFTDLYPLPFEAFLPSQFEQRVNQIVSFRKRPEIFTTLADVGVRFVQEAVYRL